MQLFVPLLCMFANCFGLVFSYLALAPLRATLFITAFVKVFPGSVVTSHMESRETVGERKRQKK